MKKIFTSLLATAAVLCASAAVPTYTVNPTSGSTIENRAFSVTFTFSEAVTVNEVELVGGARFNSQVVTVTPDTKGLSKTVKVTVPSDAWGTASAGEYLLEVVLPEVYDSEGALIQESDTDEETHETFYYPFTPRANYISPDTTPAAFVGVDPAPGDMSVWDVYYDGWGAIDFSFTAAVDMTGGARTARVRYTLSNNQVITSYVSADDIWADWNMWTGNYSLSVMLPANATLTEENLVSIEVSLAGIVSNGTTISIPTYTYTNVASPNAKKVTQTGAKHIEIETTDYVTVYSIDGTVVKNLHMNDINNLESGIYVVNGRKIAVR